MKREMLKSRERKAVKVTVMEKIEIGALVTVPIKDSL